LSFSPASKRRFSRTRTSPSRRTATAAAAARNTLTPRALEGKVTPIPEGNAVVLVAPAPEVPQFLELIGHFDQRQAVETHSYAPRYFSIAEVGRLIEKTARDPGPRGSGDRWRLVSDELTGTLIVTATPDEHARIEALIERLDSVPVEARRPVRAFPIRNRGVREVLSILGRLIEAGVLEAQELEGTPQPQEQPTQRTLREFPPGSPPRGSANPAQAAPAPSAAAHTPASRGTAAQGGPSLILTADEGTNTLVAIGDARRLDQMEKLIRTLDVRQPQIMVEVLVLSLTDADTLYLEIELEKMEISLHADQPRIALRSGDAGPRSGAEPIEGAGGTALVLDPGDFRILIRALETLNQDRSLNIPKVLVNNNQQATVDSVLQQPFLATNASQTVATTSFGATQDAGTTVTVTPRIAEGDHLVLEYTLASPCGRGTGEVHGTGGRSAQVLQAPEPFRGAKRSGGPAPRPPVPCNRIRPAPGGQPRRRRPLLALRFGVAGALRFIALASDPQVRTLSDTDQDRPRTAFLALPGPMRSPVNRSGSPTLTRERFEASARSGSCAPRATLFGPGRTPVDSQVRVQRGCGASVRGVLGQPTAAAQSSRGTSVQGDHWVSRVKTLR
jgi:hypothetical protein